MNIQFPLIIDFRHGTRYPAKGNVKKFAKLYDTIQKNKDAIPPQFDWLSNWYSLFLFVTIFNDTIHIPIYCFIDFKKKNYLQQ